jgi:hypothetical protein
MERYSAVRVAELTLWWIVLLLVGSGLGASVGAREADQEIPSQHGVRFPGGLADTARGVAFISNGGGVDSIDLRSGHRRWRSPSAIAPLALLNKGSELVAAGFDGGKIFIVLIESDSGKALRQWDLSLGVFASPETCELAIDVHEPTLEIMWKVRSRYKGGANLSPGAEERFHIDASGVVELDVRNGSVVKQERTNGENLSSHHDWPSDLTEVTVDSRVYAITSGDPQKNGQRGPFLVARERKTDRVLWEYGLAGIAKASPRLRP